MASPTSTTPAALTAPEPATRALSEYVKIVARFLISVAVSAAACDAYWARRPRQLTGTTGTLGYPSYHDFNYVPDYTAYHLLVYAFPVGTLIIYSLLAWRGPLRRAPAARKRRTTGRMLDIRAEQGDGEPLALGDVLAAGARVLLPAAVLVLAVSARSTSSHQTVTSDGLLAGVAYVVVTAVLAAALTVLRHVQPRQATAIVNAFAGPAAAIGSLWVISQNTVVVVAGHGVRHWPWLPGWLAAVGVLVCIAWAVLRLRGGRAAGAVEGRLLAVVVGACAVFIAISYLPGEQGGLQGYDDSMGLVGARLLSLGYFPWRDFMFIHGLWPDALQTTIGFAEFGATRWGGVAGTDVIVQPMTFVVIYLFAVWLARGNGWFLASLALLILAFGRNTGVVDARFIVIPLIFVLLGEALRRESPLWCAGFMLALLGEIVLVPETSYLAISSLAVVVAADLTHWDRDRGIWRSLRRTLSCAVAGLVLLAAWVVFLAAHHAVGDWIEYYRLFVPDHAAEGARPLHSSRAALVEYAIVLALVVATFWAAVARVRGGRSWSAFDWTTVAAAGFVALYGEEAIGRFDTSHIDYVLANSVPLVLLWLGKGLTMADDRLRALASRASGASQLRRRLAARYPLTAGLTAAFVAFAVLGQGVPALAAAKSLPSREHATATAEPTIPRLGYVKPGAVNATLLRDLTASLDANGGPNSPVFDMTNSLGYIYFLLARRPATAFVHVSMAMTPYGQQQLVADLRRSAPDVVIFKSILFGHGSYGMGLSGWDGLGNNVRHYEVSDYILHHYRPFLEVDGVLLLLRDGLRPHVPQIAGQAVTSNLWFSGGACNWGATPNFLSSPPSGHSVDLPVTSLGMRRTVSLDGWVTGSPGHQSVSHFVLASGRAVLRLAWPRTQGHGTVTFAAATIAPPGARITVYAVTADGALHPIIGEPGALSAGVLRLPGGGRGRIAAPIAGRVSIASTPAWREEEVKLPVGLRLTDFDLMTLRADRVIGNSAIIVSDERLPPGPYQILAKVLPTGGRSVGLRVGSCLQWYGYQSRELFISQTGGSPITELQLSGVAS